VPSGVILTFCANAGAHANDSDSKPNAKYLPFMTIPQGIELQSILPRLAPGRIIF
jgi:hypothetical protein